MAVTSPNDMPELPDNWISEPCSNLSGGQLLQIVKQAIKPLQDQINMYISLKLRRLKKNVISQKPKSTNLKRMLTKKLL